MHHHHRLRGGWGSHIISITGFGVAVFVGKYPGFLKRKFGSATWGETVVMCGISIQVREAHRFRGLTMSPQSCSPQRRNDMSSAGRSQSYRTRDCPPSSAEAWSGGFGELVLYHRDFSHRVAAFLERPPPIALLSTRCEAASRWHHAEEQLRSLYSVAREENS